MDVLSVLKTDHRTVEKIFKKLEATTAKAERQRTELFSLLKKELDAHAHTEEAIFYPRIKDKRQTHTITLEAYEEHALVKHLLKELDQDPKATEEWKAKLIVLRENVEHHVKEEERDMFKSVKKLFSKEELNELGAEVQEEKKVWLEKNA